MKKAIKILTSLKMIIGVAALSSLAMSHEILGFWILISGAVLDEIIKFLKNEIDKTNSNNYPGIPPEL